MIWLALRRHRTNLVILLGITVLLAGWMGYLAHRFDTAPTTSFPGPNGTVRSYRDLYSGPTLLRLPYQTDALNLLLLAFPCLVGALLGVPLVAGELGDHTNRLVWTQRITRTRWLSTKWWVVGLPLLLLSTLLVLATQWWSHLVVGYGLAQVFGVISFAPGSRMAPEVYSVTGVVPVVYALFAFALGTALGAILRRVSWAIVGTVVVYGLVSFVMVTTVRPNLAPKVFVAFESANATNTDGARSALLTSEGGGPWMLDTGNQFTPGFHQAPGRPTPDQVATRCESTVGDFITCLNKAHVEEGTYFQPGRNYWALQWRESAIYLVATVLLFGAGLVAVRRWRA